MCPYLVFAARTPQSWHDPAEFIVGNIFADPDIAALERIGAVDAEVCPVTSEQRRLCPPR